MVANNHPNLSQCAIFLAFPVAAAQTCAAVVVAAAVAAVAAASREYFQVEDTELSVLGTRLAFFHRFAYGSFPRKMAQRTVNLQIWENDSLHCGLH